MMTGPRSESPFASIRELAATERRLTDAMDTMKRELLTAIRSSDTVHEATHESMRNLGDVRHRRIDDFLGQEALDDAQRTGMVTAGVYTIRAFRILNEFRWLILGALLAAMVLLNDAHLSVTLR
jgi:hypothetical protein